MRKFVQNTGFAVYKNYVLLQRNFENCNKPLLLACALPILGCNVGLKKCSIYVYEGNEEASTFT